MTDQVAAFQVAVPPAEVELLRDRLQSVRWPDELDDLTTADGVSPELMRRLVDHWTGEWDWAAAERRLNELAQVTAAIDGEDLHAVHVRSSRDDATALVLLHGWPSTVLEYTGLAAELAEPADPADAAFHVIIPSLPGFGFSGPTRARGWSTSRMASAIAELVHRLGYDNYLVHGGDLGFHVASDLGVVDATHVRGIHLCLGGVRMAAQHLEDAQGAEQEGAVRRYLQYVRDESGYALIQATRPQTMAYGLTDSPLALLAWIAEKFEAWSDPAFPVDDDIIVTTAAIYWFTRTGGSSARSYQESYGGRGAARPFVDVPTSVSVFPHDLVPPVRAWAQESYRIVDWARMPAGGHFAALERPDLLTGALRRFAAAVS